MCEVSRVRHGFSGIGLPLTKFGISVRQGTGTRACIARITLALALALACTILGACSPGFDPDELATSAIEAIPAAPLAVLSGNRVPKGTPTEIYARIARGLQTCWMSGPGGLRKTHRFHAVAVPPAKGGQSKIVIFERPPKSSDSNYNGLQALRVKITPQGASALVESKNLRFPDEIGARMVDDTQRWAAGGAGCIDGGVKEGWDAKTKSSKPKAKTKS